MRDTKSFEIVTKLKYFGAILAKIAL